jgi:hypothetical protein
MSWHYSRQSITRVFSSMVHAVALAIMMYEIVRLLFGHQCAATRTPTSSFPMYVNECDQFRPSFTSWSRKTDPIHPIFFTRTRSPITRHHSPHRLCSSSTAIPRCQPSGCNSNVSHSWSSVQQGCLHDTLHQANSLFRASANPLAQFSTFVLGHQNERLPTHRSSLEPSMRAAQLPKLHP